ncbi:MAG: ATP-dependent metallopeptidase FtsH/Yme1/Tma family protein, partial [Balneolaceae bacterium]|nr:ATP-dependent metallopeptidase FtsH/Yme1/Tma family protein [Balneolaceae bacterium]
MAKSNFPQKKSSNKDKKNDKKTPRFPIWIYVVLFLVLIAFNLYFVPGNSSERIKYSEFLEYVEEGYVKEITITNQVEIQGDYSEKAFEEGLVERPTPDDNSWTNTSEGSSGSFAT